MRIQTFGRLPVTPPAAMPVSLQQPPVQAGDQFQPRFSGNLTRQALDALRSELVAQFPGNEWKYSNGSGLQPDRDRITVYHETERHRNKVVKHLLKQNVITANEDGTYQYKQATVEFTVTGRIVAQ